MPASFFCSNTAKAIWKGVAGVSSAGRKRGRGRGAGRAIIKDFNIGQQIGIGRKKIVAEGLNSPVSRTPSIPQVVEVGDNIEEFTKNIEGARTRLSPFKRIHEKPIDKGWSGRKAHGRKAGPPDDHNETPFEGFQSTVLMLRPLLGMSGVLGRTKRMHSLVVTGNGNGLAGFSTAIGKDPRSVVRHARNRASQALVSVPLYDSHTVMHNFYSRYYFTTVFVERKPKGYGIRAHRIIRAICEAFGIKDIYAKVEGSTSNQINLTKAFFLGLMNQRKYQSMADEKRLHLVELREENFNYPTVLASPKDRVRSDDELRTSDENLDFTYYINDGKIKTIKYKRQNPFINHPTYRYYLDKLDLTKNRQQTKLMLAAKYGDKKVKDIFPYFISNADSFNKPNES